ncbi:hypothetical protein [Duganella violaceipulchra]|uniref:Uncharacterized protein YybS (DUF2232 family) n=1 Tax=Duganella violaceipulchra TaxID=2849652 RepID=A0AA41L222_9BURK|nr:hypothetical protein [Duganella violaceicalia]MBV6325706.1 hypothetical protein [Duganella violaceicalia]MCP2012828.1 uncharacterized protein YybS (DUF2232 family) [Duganella violaceicalia]
MNLNLANILIAALWADLVLGISFVAQPAKFSTPGLPRPIALAAGRQMFRAMHVAESVIAVCAVVVLMLSKHTQPWPIFFAVTILATQIAVLMPPLSKRVDARLSGVELPKSAWHAIFGVTEVAKFALLLAAVILPSMHGMAAFP